MLSTNLASFDLSCGIWQPSLARKARLPQGDSCCTRSPHQPLAPPAMTLASASAVCTCPDTNNPALLCATCNDIVRVLATGYREASGRRASGSLSQAGMIVRHLRIRQEARSLGLLKALRRALAVDRESHVQLRGSSA